MKIIQKTISPSNWSIKDSYKAGICFHWIVGNLYSADSTFNDPNRKASAHFGVGDLPGQVHQYVAVNKVAYHAGDSDPFWENGYFIGIEHSGGEFLSNGTRRIPSDQCVANSIELCVDLCRKQGWDRLILPYSYDQRNQDPTNLINQYKGQRVGIAVRHRNIVNTGTECSGSLGVEFIVEKVNQILNNRQLSSQTIVNNSQNNMDKEKLIKKIQSSTIFDQPRKDQLSAAVYGDDADHLIIWSGEQAMQDHRNSENRIAELETQLANQISVKILPTEEEIKKIAEEKGYKTPEEVQVMIEDALNGIRNADILDNPIVIANPHLELPKTKTPLQSKTWTMTWTGMLAMAASIQAILYQVGDYASIIGTMVISVGNMVGLELDPSATQNLISFVLYSASLILTYLIFVMQRTYVAITKQSETDIKNLLPDMSNKLFAMIADINNRRPIKPILKNPKNGNFFSRILRKK